MNNTVEGLILQSDNPLSYDDNGELPADPPYVVTDADTLGGKPASDYMLKSDYTPVDLSEYLKTSDADIKYAAASHTHAASQVTAGKLAGIVNATDNIALDQQAVRNIYAGTSDIGVGASLPTGVIYLVYE